VAASWPEHFSNTKHYETDNSFGWQKGEANIRGADDGKKSARNSRIPI